MGRNARLKKMAKLEQRRNQKLQIGQRIKIARSPLVRSTRLLVIALVVTATLLYIGQIVNDRIAKAINTVEVSK